jgi:hypothetical protein
MIHGRAVYRLRSCNSPKQERARKLQQLHREILRDALEFVKELANHLASRKEAFRIYLCRAQPRRPPPSTWDSLMVRC